MMLLIVMDSSLVIFFQIKLEKAVAQPCSESKITESDLEDLVFYIYVCDIYGVSLLSFIAFFDIVNVVFLEMKAFFKICDMNIYKPK